MTSVNTAKYKSATALAIYVGVLVGAIVVALVGLLYIAITSHNQVVLNKQRTIATNKRLDVLEADLAKRRLIRLESDATVNAKLEKLKVDQRNQFCAVLVLLGPDPRHVLDPIKDFLHCPEVNPLLPPPSPSPSPSP